MVPRAVTGEKTNIQPWYKQLLTKTYPDLFNNESVTLNIFIIDAMNKINFCISPIILYTIAYVHM